MSHHDESTYTLPSSLVTQSDLRRLIMEIEALDNEYISSDIRDRVGHHGSQPAVFSRQLEDFLQVNQLELGEAHQRSEVLHRLRQLGDDAPVVHMTFAVSATQSVLSKMVDWVRSAVHPQAVLTVGLQPDLIGGVHVRTLNKVFDFSVKSQLANSRGVITKELEAIGGER